MMCKSNYGIGLAGAAVVAGVGADLAYIIVRRHDCELKRANMLKQILLER